MALGASATERSFVDGIADSSPSPRVTIVKQPTVSFGNVMARPTMRHFLSIFLLLASL